MNQQGHPLISTILTRTLMDSRYFYGIRTMAALGLAKCARSETNWVGFHHLERAFHDMFSLPDSNMTRPNDFSDRIAYILQSTIPRAVSMIRDNRGQTPLFAKRFIMDKIQFNDNSTNEVFLTKLSNLV